MAVSRLRRVAVAAVMTMLGTVVAVTGGAHSAQADDIVFTPWGVYDYWSECDGDGNAGLNIAWDSYYCLGGTGGTSGPYYLYVHLTVEEV
jgi:hypothetical protein